MSLRPGAARSRRGLRAVFAVVALTGLMIDAVTKVLAVQHLSPGRPVPLLGPVLRLYLVRNPGAAFSIGEEFTWVFTVLAVCVLGALLVLVVPQLGHRGWAVGLGLVVAGIAGNLVDRLVRPPGFARGHVVDFLQLPYWPIFNVADMCVVGGAILIMAIWLIRGVAHDGSAERSRLRRTDSDRSHPDADESDEKDKSGESGEKDKSDESDDPEPESV